MAVLTARLSAATQGGRELDAEIARELGWQRVPEAPALWHHPKKPGVLNHPPRYTASIDSALALVPDHDVPELVGKWRWFLMWPAYIEGVMIPDKHLARIYHPMSSGGPPMYDGFGTTPALALCVAALTAREALRARLSP